MATIPTLAELITDGIDASLNRVFTAMPGTVHSYHPLTQTVDVKLGTKRVLEDIDTDKRESEDYPVLPDLPVCFPRGGGFAITYPLSAGDGVLVVCLAQSAAEFRETGQTSIPKDMRRLHLAHAVAIPFEMVIAKSLIEMHTTDGVCIGTDLGEAQIKVEASEIKLGATATLYVALAQKVETAINTFITAYSAHTHTETGTTTSPPLVPGVPVVANATAATIVKAT